MTMSLTAKSQNLYVSPDESKFLMFAIADTNQQQVCIILKKPVYGLYLTTIQTYPLNQIKTYFVCVSEEERRGIDQIILRLQLFEPGSKYIVWVKHNKRQQSSFSLDYREGTPILY